MWRHLNFAISSNLGHIFPSVHPRKIRHYRCNLSGCLYLLILRISKEYSRCQEDTDHWKPNCSQSYTHKCLSLCFCLSTWSHLDSSLCNLLIFETKHIQVHISKHRYFSLLYFLFWCSGDLNILLIECRYFGSRLCLAGTHNP